MGHRHFSNSFNMFRTNQSHDRNHLSAEQSYIPMGRAVVPENGSFVCPTDNILRRGVQSDSQWSLEGRANEYPSSSLSMEVQHFPPAFSGPPYNPFPHSSPAGNLYLAPENNAGHVHSSYYNQQTIHDIGCGLLDPTTGTGRGAFKRKSPDMSGACERGSTSRFYGEGSSSGSSQMLLEKPIADYQSIPPVPIGLSQYRGSSHSIAGEDSLRNVRSRSRLEFEPNTTRTHQSNYSSHLYHSTIHPTNHSGAVDLANLNADASSRNWNLIPFSAAAHGRVPTSDFNGLSHEINPFLVGGSVAVSHETNPFLVGGSAAVSHETNPFLVGRTAAEIGGFHHDSVSIRHPVASSQYLHGPPAQAAREGHSNQSRRAIPSYRTNLSFSQLGHEADSSDNGPHSLPESFSSRYSRPLPTGGWRNSYRNGRSRIATERFQSISGVVDAHDRMGSEAVMMVDHSSFYGASRNLFDQYGDMRLDIDSMGYEELLALGERIGNVSTGLSEDMTSKCLIEKVYFSLDQIHEEVTCAICLEEYRNEDKVGTLKNCGHDYHVGCIKKWLLMKNDCPICKGAALTVC